jgi:hypothetical protein
VLCTKGQGGVVAGKSVSHHHRHSAWQRTERWRVCGDTGMTEMSWATGSIYSGDPGVDRSHLVSSHLIILSYNELHTLSFPAFALTRSFRDFVDPRNCVHPHGRVVSYLLTLFLRSSSQNRSFSRILFGMPREVRRSVDNGLSAF